MHFFEIRHIQLQRRHIKLKTTVPPDKVPWTQTPKRVIGIIALWTRFSGFFPLD